MPLALPPLLKYGPFRVCSLDGVTSQELASDPSGEPWTRVGLVVDPAAYRNDRQQLARHIEAFFALVAQKTGDEVMLDPQRLAAYAFAEGRPVILPRIG